jgi:hypothetical protein
MFNRVEEQVIKVLQEEMKGIPKNSISTKIKDLKKTPAVQVTNVSFRLGDKSLGRPIVGEENLQKDVFSGDGKKTEYKLSEKPVRPIISVESPIGSRIDESMFTIGYREATITFNDPPETGKNNIAIRYIKPFETVGLHLNLTYHINVYGDNEEERDTLTEKVLESVLKGEERLNGESLSLEFVKGFNITVSPENLPNSYGKTIEYTVNTPFIVLIESGIMEEIEIKPPRQIEPS